MDRNDIAGDDPRMNEPGYRQALAELDAHDMLAQGRGLGSIAAEVYQELALTIENRNWIFAEIKRRILEGRTNHQGASPIPCRPQSHYRLGQAQGGLLVLIFVVLGIIAFFAGIWFCGRHGNVTW